MHGRAAILLKQNREQPPLRGLRGFAEQISGSNFASQNYCRLCNAHEERFVLKAARRG
jgi:hypothetical protein